MVKRECIEIENIDAVRDLIASARMLRAANGEWTLVLDLDGELLIDDRRALPVRGDLRIRGRQRGRLANPAWGETSKLRKKSRKGGAS